MAHPGFGERFGYACWLYHLVTGRAPAFAQIGGAAGRSGVAIAAWLKMPEAPDTYSIRRPTADFLGVPEGWLFDGTGDPPRSELWDAWMEARGVAPAEPSWKRAARTHGGEIAQGSAAPPGKAAKGAKKRRPA